MASKPLNAIRHEVRYWLLRRLPTCEHVVPVLSESLERRLGLRERALVTTHIFTCIWCEWYRDHLRALRKLAPGCADASREAAGHQLSTPARDRIRRRLSEARG